MVVLVIVAMITMMVLMVAMAVVTWMLHEEHLLAATQPLLGRNREKRVWRWHTEDAPLEISPVRIKWAIKKKIKGGNFSKGGGVDRVLAWLPKANWLGNQTRVHLACLKFFWEAEAINVRDRDSSWSGHYTSFLVVIIQLNPRCSAWEKWKVKLSQKLDSVKLSRIITVSYGTRWNSRMV